MNSVQYVDVLYMMIDSIDNNTMSSVDDSVYDSVDDSVVFSQSMCVDNVQDIYLYVMS